MTDETPTDAVPEGVYDVTGWHIFYWLANELGGEIVAVDNGDGTFTYTLEYKIKVMKKEDEE